MNEIYRIILQADRNKGKDKGNNAYKIR